MKRENYISWDELFIGIAELTSKRSKDPSTQNGACIVKNNKILSIGYNGLPYNLSDDGYNTYAGVNDLKLENSDCMYDYWGKPQKYEFVVHAEENALFNATTDLTGSTLYLYSEKGYYPCSKCARGIVQKGIIKVVMKTAIQNNTSEYDWSYTKHMFKQAGIEIKILSDI